MSLRGFLIGSAAIAAISIASTLARARQDEAETIPRETASSAAPAASRGEVQIVIESFGVGGVVRPGEWAAIRVALADSAVQPRNVAVTLSLKDADGDTVHYDRLLTTTPGEPRGVWLYAPMPPSLQSTTLFGVAVHEVDAEGDTPRITRQIGHLRFMPQQVPATVIESGQALIGVVGRATMGLDQYAATARGHDYSIAAHELTRVVPGLVIDDRSVPDLWMGWSAFESIVWLPGATEPLGTEYAAKALREWVHRGGHLVIVAPAVGTAWRNPSSPLADLLPACEVERLEDRDLEPYREWLTTPEFDSSPLPGRTVVHRFIVPDGTPPADASAIIRGPDGVVVCRRLVGSGMVTVVGIDAANRALHTGQVLRADAFWNRILGKRCDTPTAAVFEKNQARGSRLYAGVNTVWVDRSVGDEISRTRQAGLGILVSLALFAAYCIAFGFGGFKLLELRGWLRHAWVAAAATTAVWSVATWALATWLRPKEVQAAHLTILDHVYGQPVERARVWAGVLLPTYGSQRISLGDPGVDQSWRQALFPWIDPESDSGSAFPDSREYRFDTLEPHHVSVPTRSTIKQVQCDWLGGPRWSMPTPTAPEFEPRLEFADGKLSGRLIHKLPAALKDVIVVLVRRQDPRRRDASLGRTGTMIAEAFAWELAQSWPPGAELDLAPFSKSTDAKAAADSVLESWVPRVLTTGLPDLVGSPKDFRMVSFYSLLHPPEYTRDALGLTGSVPGNPKRRLVHTLDLGKWFTQPCLIITGMLEDERAPVPLFVDGRPCPSRGRTVVRWVYPLRADPITFDE